MAFGLAWVLDHADTAEKQDAAAAALVFKTDVLWAQLDALWAAYVEPGRIPPGAWRPGEGLVAAAAASMHRGRRRAASLPRGVRLHASTRCAAAWVLLAPERALTARRRSGWPILREVDGRRTLAPRSPRPVAAATARRPSRSHATGFRPLSAADARAAEALAVNVVTGCRDGADDVTQ